MLHTKSKNLRSFIGAKDYKESRQFYKELGFIETVLSDDMCLFEVKEEMGFYLQKAYVKDWVDNSMLFLEVDDVEAYWQELLSTGLDKKYKLVKFTPIKTFDHGRHCFMHDPSGVLWHFCEFNKE